MRHLSLKKNPTSLAEVSQSKLLNDSFCSLPWLILVKYLININSNFRFRMSCWRCENPGIYCHLEVLEARREKQCLKYNHFTDACSQEKAGPGPSFCPVSSERPCSALTSPACLPLAAWPSSRASSFWRGCCLLPPALARARLALVHWFGGDPLPVALTLLPRPLTSLTSLGMKNGGVLKTRRLHTLGGFFKIKVTPL